MRLLFCYNSTALGSRLIRWVLNEPVSHVAIQFSNGLIVHSTFSGVGLSWNLPFRMEYCIPWEWELPSIGHEQEVMRVFLDLYVGRKYDIGAFLYFGWRAVLLKVAGVPLPGRNLWNKDRDFLCTELAAYLLGMEPDPMISPYKLYLKLTNREAGRI